MLNPKQVSYFLYWVKERHRMHLARASGDPKPWTTDPVLQQNFFTNPFRENDKTTQWFRKWVRDPLRDSWKVIMATHIFRRFNYIPTGQVLLAEGLLEEWDSRHAIEVLKGLPKIFTGAFMVSSPAGKPKLNEICRMIDEAWLQRYAIRQQLESCTRLADAFKYCQFEHHRGLLAYEMLTDLRWTYLLRDAEDVNTWAFYGPGGQRGARRMLGLEVKRTPRGKQMAVSLDQDTCNLVGRKLLEVVQRSFADDDVMRRCVVKERAPDETVWWTEHDHIFEARDIEHSLCETDKYLRICEGSGRSKRVYDGT